ESDPTTFAPLGLADNDVVPLPPVDIAVVPAPSEARYTVVTAIDLTGGTTLARQAVLGGSQTVYMSPNNLYLAAPDYGQDPVQTHITRIALGDSDLKVAAQRAVPGTLLNQFALDEFAGHLRVVITSSGPDPATEIWSQSVSLLVLDGELAQVGAVDLVEDESVQAVRFAGTTGYVVTFQQVDPLFAVDLTRPDAPRVMSALKIPGFSTYLHPWGDGRLVGLGVNADENGFTDKLKISLFDITDPYAVTELTSAVVDADDSVAMSDHRAVWADPDRGLIGFPAMSWESDRTSTSYLVYSVDDGGRAARRAILPLDSAPGYGVDPIPRGVRVGDHLYICSAAAVAVYDLSTFTEVADLTVNDLPQSDLRDHEEMVD
ncbi:MAG: beta-propeller domain-containing protein, partial [Bifidobacteriaceae bacterium]|nr:beta-propeller domain-containing protein [Bifidobacteriaceae bacterium]